jgi:hypothetical protein
MEVPTLPIRKTPTCLTLLEPARDVITLRGSCWWHVRSVGRGRAFGIPAEPAATHLVTAQFGRVIYDLEDSEFVKLQEPVCA